MFWKPLLPLLAQSGGKLFLFGAWYDSILEYKYGTLFPFYFFSKYDRYIEVNKKDPFKNVGITMNGIA